MSFKPFQIGKYYFEELLGRGGNAEVYRVTARGAGSFQKQFAVKRIIPGTLDNEDAIQRFKEEAHFNSKMSHPNVVQVFDFIKADDNFLLVMEYVHGPDLAAVLDRFRKRHETVPSAFAAYVTQMTCQGLDHAYHYIPPKADKPLRIVHRDISPQNIMIAYDGHVKIVDFGIAKATQMIRTQTGLVKGKMQYFSPEQANAKPVDHRSDIFSTAILLLEMLFGDTIYHGLTDLEILREAQARRIPDFNTKNPLIPIGLYPILEKALQFEPDQRYQTVGEMAQDLKRFLEAIAPDYGQQALAAKMASLFENEKRRANAPSAANMPLSTKEELGLMAGLQSFGDALGISPDQGELVLPADPNTNPNIQLQTRINFRLPSATYAPRLRKWKKRLAVAAPIFAALFFLKVSASKRAARNLAKATTDGAACSLSVVSTPPKARATVDDAPAGETPLSIKVRCGASVRLTLQRNGYKTYSGSVTVEDAQGSVRIALESTKGRDGQRRQKR